MSDSAIADFQLPDQTANAIEPAATQSKPTPRRAPSYGVAMKWIRRIHLYSGLFLFPWVMLYGVTALFFNRPEVMSEQTIRSIGAKEVTGTALENPPSAADLAAQVVAKLQAKRETPGAEPYRLVDPQSARFANDLSLTARDETQEHQVRIDLSTGAGKISSRPAAPRERPRAEAAPFAVASGLELDRPVFDEIRDSVKTVLARHGLQADEIAPSRFPPSLSFLMEADGKRWRVNYQLTRGAVSARPEETTESLMPVRQFLLRLHTAHGYPLSWGVRFAWAIVVDIMFASMVFWGVSGIFMWWQIRSVRMWGAVTLILSAVVAVGLTLGMHANMNSPEASASRGSPGPTAPEAVESKSSREPGARPTGNRGIQESRKGERQRSPAKD